MKSRTWHSQTARLWARGKGLLLGVALATALMGTTQPVQAQEKRIQDEQTSQGPAILREVGIDQKLNEQVPLNLEFRDESGKVVTLGQYFTGQRPVVLTLVYYECPMLCTEVLNGLVRALRVLPANWVLGRDFDIVTVSFNPAETPELAQAKKNTYLAQYKKPEAGAGWHFLTGKEPSIRRLTQSVGFRYVYDEKLGQYAHAAAIMLLTPEGKVSRYFYGVDYPPKDLRLGLTEASNGKAGGLSEQILLLCYHYDPVIGRYSLLTLRLVQIGGIVTLLALGTFLFIMFRRDWRKSPPSGGQSNEVKAP